MTKLQLCKFLLALPSLLGLGCLSAETCDSLFFNGTIYTVDKERPYVEAVAVKDGKIFFCGKKEDALKYKSEKTVSIDLQGNVLLPGFIAAHTHVFMEALIRTNLDVSPETHKTTAAVLKTLKEAAKKGPVLALGYDPSLMDEHDDLGFLLLDEVTTSYPVMVINKSWHIAYCNSRTFELAGIKEDVKNPLGGAYERDASGKLTGVADEVPAITALISAFPIFKHINFYELGQVVTRLYAKNGYTTVTDMGLGFPMPSPDEHIDLMRRIAEDPVCPVRLQGYVVFSMMDKIKELQKQNTERWKVLGMKIWADGSLQGYTGALTKPYLDRTSEGKLNFPQATLTDFICKAHSLGLQVAIHANGDKAIENSLNGIQKALELAPSNDPRFRIEHCTVSTPTLLEKMVLCKATPSFSEEHVYIWGDVFQNDILGYGRTKYLDAAKTAEKLGLKFSFNDDVLGSLNPLLFVQTAVTRMTASGKIISPHEAISVEEALRAVTIYPAWQCFRDHELGSIKEGKLADFVLLDKDPTKVDPAAIKAIKILSTWTNGKKN